MNRFSVKCPDCTYPLDAEQYNSTTVQACRSCRAKLLVFALPALYLKKKLESRVDEAQLEDAACFYHTEKKAEQLCDDCGRFLCNLCTLPFGDEVICASCLELRRKQETGRHQLKPRQVRYDKLAMMLAVVPLILYFPLTFITAPAAVFVALRYWGKKLDFAPAMRARMVLAMVFSILQMCGWGIAIFYIMREISSGA